MVETIVNLLRRAGGGLLQEMSDKIWRTYLGNAHLLV
jgi:hypothetical protein